MSEPLCPGFFVAPARRAERGHAVCFRRLGLWLAVACTAPAAAAAGPPPPASVPPAQDARAPVSVPPAEDVPAPATTGSVSEANAAAPASADAAPTAPATPPQLVRCNEGAVLAAPKLQLLPVGSAPLAGALQAFVEAWRNSAAWAAMTAEYGVGPLTVLPPRSLASPFVGTVLDVDDDAGELEPSAVEALLGAALGSQADGNTVYVVLLPEGVPASLSPEVPDACAAHVWAWHSASALRVGTGEATREVVVPYVVLPACAARGAMGALDRKTAALSHAVVHAVTNPAGRGHAGVDAGHVASELASGDGELGSLCTQALWRSSSWTTKPADLPYAVARVWSNAESRAQRMPCVPAVAAEADYFRAEAQLPGCVAAALDGGTRAVPTPGVALAPGAQVQLPVRWLARTPDAAAFAVTAQEVGTNELTLSLEQQFGRPGDVARLTVRLAEEPEHAQHLVRLTARRGELAFSTYFLVRQREAP